MEKARNKSTFTLICKKPTAGFTIMKCPLFCPNNRYSASPKVATCTVVTYKEESVLSTFENL